MKGKGRLNCLTVDLESEEGIASTLRLAEVVDYKLTVYVTGELLENFGSECNFLRKCCVGLHGYHHVHLSELSVVQQREEIAKAVEIYKRFFGCYPQGWRSPYLSFNKHTLKILHEFKFKWDSSFERSRWTWLRRLQSPVFLIPIDKPLNQVHSGTVLLHDRMITSREIEEAKKLDGLTTHEEVYKRRFC